MASLASFASSSPVGVSLSSDFPFEKRGGHLSCIGADSGSKKQSSSNEQRGNHEAVFGLTPAESLARLKMLHGDKAVDRAHSEVLSSVQGASGSRDKKESKSQQHRQGASLEGRPKQQVTEEIYRGPYDNTFVGQQAGQSHSTLERLSRWQ
jgi:hypothetical protein